MHRIKRLLLTILVLASVSTVATMPAQAKIAHGTKFATVYQGKTVVFCRLSYSLQYNLTDLLCLNHTHTLQFIPIGKAYDLGRTDDSIQFPDSAPALYVGDYWSRGPFTCVVKSYGRLRCISDRTNHWFTAGATFINIDF